MNKLKELTWNTHHRAERTKFAAKLLAGLNPVEYHKYLINQHEIYTSLESAADHLINQFPELARSKKIKHDIEELEVMYNLGFDPTMICPVVHKYRHHVSTLDEKGLLAHLYVRHFGDMYGGQIIKKRNPGSGKMYEFDNVEELKSSVRKMLSDDMADEANRCFDFAIQLFEELDSE